MIGCLSDYMLICIHTLLSIYNLNNTMTVCLVNQINPKYTEAVRVFPKDRRGLEKGKEFLKIYEPLRRNLIRAFETTLCV
jgi:hypothetical protein